MSQGLEGKMGSGGDVGMNERGKCFKTFDFMGDVGVEFAPGCKD